MLDVRSSIRSAATYTNLKFIGLSRFLLGVAIHPRFVRGINDQGVLRNPRRGLCSASMSAAHQTLKVGFSCELYAFGRYQIILSSMYRIMTE